MARQERFRPPIPLPSEDCPLGVTDHPGGVPTVSARGGGRRGAPPTGEWARFAGGCPHPARTVEGEDALLGCVCLEG